MADELTVGLTLDYSKGELSGSAPAVSGVLATLAGSVLTHAVLSIGTGKENLLLSADHGTLGLVRVKNLDAANYVSFGADADSPFLELKKGESAQFRLSRAISAISAKANTAAVKVEYWVFDD